MSAPRHLWSGDWQSESASHAQELAARRGRGEPPVEPELAPAPGAPRPGRLRLALRIVRERLRGLRAARPRPRRVRIALLATFVTLLLAGAAYAVASDLGATRSPQPAAANSPGAWLGVNLSAGVGGARVAAVVPGSPAAIAGIKPGDVITALDTQPIVTPAILVAAISGLQPGDTVDIQLQRGASQYTVHVVLGTHNGGP